MEQKHRQEKASITLWTKRREEYKRQVIHIDRNISTQAKLITLGSKRTIRTGHSIQDILAFVHSPRKAEDKKIAAQHNTFTYKIKHLRHAGKQPFRYSNLPNGTYPQMI